MQLKLKTDKETFVAHMSGLRNRELSKTTDNASKSTSESRRIRTDDTPTSVSLTGLDKDEGDTEERQHEGGGASAPMEIATPNSGAAATPGYSLVNSPFILVEVYSMLFLNLLTEIFSCPMSNKLCQ